MNFLNAVSAARKRPISAPAALHLLGIGEGSNADVGNSPLSVSFSASSVAGNLCVLLVSVDSPLSSTRLLTPAGWTFVNARADANADVETLICYKFLDTSDISTGFVEVVYDFAYAGMQAKGYAMTFEGADATNPIDVHDTKIRIGSSVSIDGLIPNYSGGYIGVFFGFDGADGDPFTLNTSGWSILDEYEVPAGGSGGDLSGALISKDLLSQAGVDFGALSVTASANDGFNFVLFVVKAA